MSRLRKLNRQRNKKISSTISGLALSLIIGFTGAIGSYSYFSDKVDIKNDLEITLGSLNTSVSKGIDIQGLKPGEVSDKTIFTIKNDGNIAQSVSLDFETVSEALELSQVRYNATIIKKDKYGNVVEGYKKITLDEPFNNLFNLNKYDLGNLNPEEYFECIVKIDATDLIIYENTDIKFNVEVDSRQL